MVTTSGDARAPTSDASAQIAQPPEPSVNDWSLATRVLFRLAFIYFGLYVLATPILKLLIPFFNFRMLGTRLPCQAVVLWFVRYIFHITHHIVLVQTGSGDKIFDWVENFCILMLALLATAVWSALDRKRMNYSVPYGWFRFFIRFSLAATMVTYGMSKVVPLQMPSPDLVRLLERFGNFSPMGVLWASVGASKGYEMFAGCAELAGGILLFWPRTTTVGALICLADTINIFVLNMTYDVPVKLFSFNLILLTSFLLARDARRLTNVFLLNRVAPPATETPRFRHPLASRVAVATQVAFGIALVLANAHSAAKAYDTYGPGRPRPLLYGIWSVQDFSVDGQLHPPLLTDKARWRRMIFDFPRVAIVQRMDGTMRGYGAKIDLKSKTLALTKYRNKTWKAEFLFERPAPNQLVLDGTMDNHKLHMRLGLFDESKFLLVRHGFHWIQEYPFNR